MGGPKRAVSRGSPWVIFHSGIELFGNPFSFQGELILATAYGYEAHEHDDVMIDAAKKVNKFGAAHILPGALLVNDIPLRMYSGSRFLRNMIDLKPAPFSAPHP